MQIDNSSEPLTIHLVLSPGAHPQHASSSTIPQSRTSQPTLPPPTRTSPAASTQVPPPVAITHTAPDAPLQVPPPPGQPPQPQANQANPFPQLQQTFALMNQQIAAQMAALGANPAMQNVVPNQPQGQPPIPPLPPMPPLHRLPQQPHLPHQPRFPQYQALQPHIHNQHHHHHPPGHPVTPQVPQDPSMQNNPNLVPQQALHQHMAQQSQLRHQNQLRVAAERQAMNPASMRSNSAPPPGLGNTNTVIRETYGPNGERHQSIVSSGMIQIHRGAQMPTSDPQQRGSSRSGIHQTETPNNQSNPLRPGEIPDSILDAPLLNLRLQLIQAHMLSMELAMNLGSIPPDSVQDQVRSLLQSVAALVGQQQYQSLVSRRQSLSDRAATMRRNLDTQLHRAAEQVESQRPTQSSEEAAVYLLSSRNGPQALLISPSGRYTAPWPVERPLPPPPVQAMGLPDPPFLNLTRHAPLNAQQVHINAVQPPPAPNADQVIPPPQPAPQDLAQRQQHLQAQNQARDIVRILIPLGGHLWLLIRLFGFVYFFTHGASWHRTILLSLVAILLFVAQTGLFQPLLQSLWGPVRRHAQALLPLAGNEPVRRGDAPGTADGNARPQRMNEEPTPQEAAERLLREREAHDGNLVRLLFRRIERAVALFVASLIPGVGERHIAAREAAEAARQQQEREREEQNRRNEEERQRGPDGEESGPGNGSPDPSRVDESNGGAAPAVDQANQLPLVEV